MIRPTAMIPNHSASDTPPASRARAGRPAGGIPFVALPVDGRVKQHDVDAAEHQERELQAEVEACVGVGRPGGKEQRSGDEHHGEPEEHPRPHLPEHVRDAVVAHGPAQQPQVEPEHGADRYRERHHVAALDEGVEIAGLTDGRGPRRVFEPLAQLQQVQAHGVGALCARRTGRGKIVYRNTAHRRARWHAAAHGVRARGPLLQDLFVAGPAPGLAMTPARGWVSGEGKRGHGRLQDLPEPEVRGVLVVGAMPVQQFHQEAGSRSAGARA